MKLQTGFPVIPPPPQLLGPWSLTWVDSQNVGSFCLNTVLNMIPVTSLLKLLSLGHPVSLIRNSEPDEMSRYTQTSSMPTRAHGWPCPAPFLSEETGEVVLFS